VGTQRIILLASVLALVLGGVFYFKPSKTERPLRLCTWSNYYPETMLQDFTEKTGIRLELSYISSNEELLAKFKAGATDFDLIQPSDYMVRQMKHLNMLAPIDHAQLTNLSHLDPFYLELAYDPGLKYSVPFTWGTTGIAVNTAKVKLPEGQSPTWKLLLESPDARHTSLLDDMREVFGAVLMWRGESINSQDPKQLERAKGDIAGVKNRILMFSSEPRPLLLKGELNIAHVYSVDGLQAGQENRDIKYFIPSEGATLWTDNFAIPKNSARVSEAHQFINYFLDPVSAVKIATENYLATPNKTARAQLPAEHTENPSFYPPPEVMKRLHFLEDLGDTTIKINRMWTELKSS